MRGGVVDATAIFILKRPPRRRSGAAGSILRDDHRPRREGGSLVLDSGAAEDAIAVPSTAPASATSRLKGVCQPKGGCGNGVGATITGLGARYADASQPWAFDSRRSMSTGQMVEIPLDSHGSDLCDGTWLDLVVSPQ